VDQPEAAEPTEATAEPAKRNRGGRPRSTAEPATAFDAWARRSGFTSSRVAELLRDAAEASGVPASAAPSISFVDDLRRGRNKPSLVVAWLVKHASAGEVDLEHWVRDAIQRGDLLRKG